MSIALVLSEFYYDHEWSIVEDDYSTLDWKSKTPKPSLKDLEAKADDANRNAHLRVIRKERDGLLAASDWTQVADAPVDAKAWAAYRQKLRDLPETIKDPTVEIDWPEPP